MQNRTLWERRRAVKRRALFAKTAPLLGSVAALALCGLCVWGDDAPPAPPPTTDAVYTSTRNVSRLLVAPDGAIWAATGGGVLRRDAQTKAWRKWTRADGLPSNEARGFVVGGDGAVTVLFPRHAATVRDGEWRVRPLSPKTAKPGVNVGDDAPTSRVTWNQGVWGGAATVGGLMRGTGKNRFVIRLPASANGAYISDLLAPLGDKGPLLVAVFGDARLWNFGGVDWTPALLPALPPETHGEVTALAQTPNGALYAGTRRAGVWQLERGAKRWTVSAPRDQTEPFDHNAQAFALYHGDLYVSTLDNGLAVQNGATGTWGHIAAPTISSDAPRQMETIGDALWVRHGDGKVDKFDGRAWTRDVWRAALPRKQASALAVTEDRIYAAQWGGWSETGDNGKSWTHRLTLPALQGVPVTTLLPDRATNTLWVGTQGRGLAECDLETGAFRAWRNERDGLPDDWITTLCRVHDTVYAGTFVGGLALKRDSETRWTTEPRLAGENVTALAPARNSLYIATRQAVFRRTPNNALTRLQDDRPALDTETQCLLPTDSTLWVGTRTAVWRLRTN